MNLKIRKFYEASDPGIGGAYSDKEKIDYEGLAASLKLVIAKVNEGSELHKEITKLEELANELVLAWTSEASQKAKSSVEEVNSELINMRTELNNLLAELTKYSDTANAINAGTMPRE